MNRDQVTNSLPAQSEVIPVLESVSQHRQDLHQLTPEELHKKEKILQLLSSLSVKNNLESLEQTLLALPEALSKQPEFVSLAQQTVQEILERTIGEFSRKPRGMFSESGVTKERVKDKVARIRALQQKFEFQETDSKNDPASPETLFQRTVEEAFIRMVRTVYRFDQVQLIRELHNAFALSQEFYSSPKLHRAVRKKILPQFFKLLDQPGSIAFGFVRMMQNQFGIPLGELESHPRFQEKAIEYIKKRINKVDTLSEFLDVKQTGEQLFIPETIATPLLRKAELRLIANELKPLSDFLELSESSVRTRLNEILEKHQVTPTERRELEKIVLGDTLKTLDTKRLELNQRVFSISDEQLRTPDFLDVAKDTLVHHLLSKTDTAEALFLLQEKFLPGLDPNEIQQTILQDLMQKGEWKTVSRLRAVNPDLEPVFEAFVTKQKELAGDATRPFAERKPALDTLARICEEGELLTLLELASLLKERSHEPAAPESKRGLDPLQEMAFLTLMRLDNPDANGVLFTLLLTENVSTTVKYAILRKLLGTECPFFTEELKDKLHSWLYSAPAEKLDWRDLSFFADIKAMPSTELQESTLNSLGKSEHFSLENATAHQRWESRYSMIPGQALLQLMALESAGGNRGLLEKFQALYTAIRKESRKKDKLLFVVSKILQTDPQIFQLCAERLNTLDFRTPQDADALSDILNALIFFDATEEGKLSVMPRTELSNFRWRRESVPPEVQDLLRADSATAQELADRAKHLELLKLHESFNLPTVTEGTIKSIQESWGTLEPISTYIGRFPSLKPYVAELIAHVPTAEEWKGWRYDLAKPGVIEHLNNLRPEQLSAWASDFAVELEELTGSSAELDRPAQIRGMLLEAIVDRNHLYDAYGDHATHRVSSEVLKPVFAELQRNPEDADTLLSQAETTVRADIRNLDAVINVAGIPKIRQTLEKTFAPTGEVTPSAKLKNAVQNLFPFLSPEQRDELEQNYKTLESRRNMSSNEVLTPALRQSLESKISDFEEAYQFAESADTWEKLNIDPSELQNKEPLYTARKELRAALDLLRLCALTPRLIAKNRITEADATRGKETITNTMETLKKYFSDTPFLEDLENIDFLLKKRTELAKNKRLGIIFTDHPQILWQVGKYPRGNGSCQHYAEGSHADKLMGYVGDPNCKVAFLVDIQKLPDDTKKIIAEQGFDAAVSAISKQDILEAGVGRSIVKLMRDGENAPVLVLEPTYTVLNKQDLSLDEFFNQSIRTFVAEPMNAKIARSQGSEYLVAPQSLSPGGQYEDLDLSSMQYIS